MKKIQKQGAKTERILLRKFKYLSKELKQIKTRVTKFASGLEQASKRVRDAEQTKPLLKHVRDVQEKEAKFEQTQLPLKLVSDVQEEAKSEKIEPRLNPLQLNNKLLYFLYKLDYSIKSLSEANTTITDLRSKSEIFTIAIDLIKDSLSISHPSNQTHIEKRIEDTYGDISPNCSNDVPKHIHFLFYAVIKNMNDLKLEQINDSKMLEWRDTINVVLYHGFRVNFAKEHLEKIAHSYFVKKGMDEGDS